MQFRQAPISQSSAQAVRVAEKQPRHLQQILGECCASLSGGRAVLSYCLVSARETDVWNNRQVPAKSTISALAVSFEKEDFYSLTLQPR